MTVFLIGGLFAACGLSAWLFTMWVVGSVASPTRGADHHMLLVVALAFAAMAALVFALISRMDGAAGAALSKLVVALDYKMLFVASTSGFAGFALRHIAG